MKLSNLPWLCKCTSCLEKNTYIVTHVPSKSASKIQSEYLQNPDTFQKSSYPFYTTTTKTLSASCSPIFNLWCCAWEETFASQRGKASRRDGQIPCIEGRAVSVSHAHRRIWWWRHWDGWKIGKKTEAQRVLLNKNSFDCRGCINPSCTNYTWFPNFKNWFCLRGRDHPIFQKPTAL